MAASTPNETKQARHADLSPQARRLLLVGEWVARAFVVEGGGWPQPAFLESGALGRRGELVGSQKRAGNDASFRKGYRGAGIEPSAHRLLLVG